MRNFVLASLLVSLVGCSGSHMLVTSDGGAPTDGALAPDAFVPASGCRLADPDGMPGSAGEACYCDGPFALRGDVAYRLSFMLEVIDLSDADHPRLVTSMANEARYAADVEIVGDVLFAAGGALERFDLHEPLAPVSLGLVDLGGEASALGVDGNRLVVAIRRMDGTHAIRAIDATDPRAIVLGAPIELGALETSSIALAGTSAFAVTMDVDTGAGSIQSIDLASGRVVDTFALDGGVSLSAIVAHAGHLFVSDLSDGLALIDATNPAALVDLGHVSLEATSVFSLALSGDRLIVLGGGVWLYDASSPRALAPLGHANWTYDLGHAALTGDHLFVSGGNTLTSLPLVCD